jgi:hypothetical protein
LSRLSLEAQSLSLREDTHHVIREELPSINGDYLTFHSVKQTAAQGEYDIRNVFLAEPLKAWRGQSLEELEEFISKHVASGLRRNGRSAYYVDTQIFISQPITGVPHESLEYGFGCRNEFVAGIE